VAVETARRTLIEDTSTLESLRHILANILNLDKNSEFQVANPPDHHQKIPGYDDLLRDALTFREDIRSQNLLIRQNEERIKEVRASYLPSVAANVDASTSDQSGGNPRFENDVQGSLSLRIPLYSAGQKAIEVKEATLQAQQARLQQQQLIKQVEQQTKDAWLDARRLSKTLEILQVQVQAAEVSYNELQDRYRSGEVPNIDVLSALNELITSRRDLTVETYRLQLALRNLERVSSTFQTERVQRAP
jgi:outer membrane protein TolC